MAWKAKVIEGLKFRFVVEEVNEQDRNGRSLLYLASVYLQVRGSSRMYLVRRSRIPGSAARLEQDAKLGKIDVGHLVDA